MKKILCPTDFSATSEKALEYAVFIARNAGARLSLLHVVHLPIVDTSETALVASELLGQQIHDAEIKLKAACEHLDEKYSADRSRGFTCDYMVKEALLTDIALHLSKEEGYDLIVMGTTGCDNTVEEILIGSNTESVIEEVKCPVLSVPATAVTPPSLQKIIYASDFSSEDMQALHEIVQLGSLFGSTINVVHVVKEHDAENRAKAEAFFRSLREVYPNVPLHFEVVVNKHRDEGLKVYYKQAGGNVMAIVRRNKGFLRELFSQSLAERLTYQAEVPLLVLHGKKN